MSGDDTSMDLFFELFSGLPRQGPGSRECTLRALAMVPPLSGASRILDIGCGTGTPTLELARATPATIVAVDIHPPFIDELNASAARRGFGDRVQGVVGDMQRLAFPSEHFDLVWSEGAIFITGFDAGLLAWRDLTRTGGSVVVSELCWFRENPSPECAEWLTAEYPPVRSVDANRTAIVECGYTLIGDFIAPAEIWWPEYYEPLERNIAAFRARHPNHDGAREIADRTEREIAMFRRYSDEYGYAFFVMRK